MKLIYLAGAISANNHLDFLHNLRFAFDVARRLIKMGYAVYVPHLDYQLFLDSNDDYIPSQEEIFNNSLEMLKRCDELWVLPNWENSKGVRKEIDLFIQRGKEKDIVYLEQHYKTDEELEAN